MANIEGYVTRVSTFNPQGKRYGEIVVQRHSGPEELITIPSGAPAPVAPDIMSSILDLASGRGRYARFTNVQSYPAVGRPTYFIDAHYFHQGSTIEVSSLSAPRVLEHSGNITDTTTGYQVGHLVSITLHSEMESTYGFVTVSRPVPRVVERSPLGDFNKVGNKPKKATTDPFLRIYLLASPVDSYQPQSIETLQGFIAILSKNWDTLEILYFRNSADGRAYFTDKSVIEGSRGLSSLP